MLPVAKAALGAFHPDYLDMLLGFGEAHETSWNMDTATRQFEEAVDGYWETLGPEDPRTLAAIKRQKESLL